MRTLDYISPTQVLSVCLASILLMSACNVRTSPEQPIKTFPDPGREKSVFEGIPVAQAGPGPEYQVRASLGDNPATRSRLEENDTGAQLIWTQGDVFTAHFIKDGTYYTADFSTASNGSSSAVFITHSDLDGEDFVCFYPGFERMNTDSDGLRVFDIVIPTEQTAVAGGIAERLNRAVAYTDRFDGKTSLSFKNLSALLRFRISGDLAANITRITMSATCELAGSKVISWKDGEPYYYPGRFKDEVLSPTVTLSGTFSTDTDYYISIWPGTTIGFEMSFYDADGHFSTLRSSKAITFTRSDITDFGTIDLGDIFKGEGTISTDPILYQQATAGTKPVTIAVVPDGFTRQELPQYERLARMALDYLFSTEPYRSYKDRFNAYILKVASNESGASITDGNGKVTTARDTYFGTAWGESSYSDMTADDSKVRNFVSSQCPDIKKGLHTINEVPVVILVNDVRYGGLTYNWNNGRAYCIIPFTMAGSPVRWSYPSIVPVSEESASKGYRDFTKEDLAEVGLFAGDWRNTFLHEFSHAFGRLMDEYWYTDNKVNASEINDAHKFAVPFGLNLSTSYSNPPWQELLDRKSELMAINPAYGRIGKYQGGDVAMYNVWRSERVSCMIDNRPYFSAWQRYLLVQRIMTLSGDGASFSYESWLKRDVPTDPVRDGVGTRSVDYDWVTARVPLVPMTAPPVLMEE